MSEKPGLGVGRLLIAVYAVFALSATARASYQLFESSMKRRLPTRSL